MKTWFLTLALMLATTLSGVAQAKQNVPEVFTLGRDLCLATARTQLLDSCDFHAEIKTRKSSMWGMALEICGTYGESNPARESHCYARAAALIKDEDTKDQASKCTGLSSAGEKSSCFKKVFTAKEGEKRDLVTK
jgi:hypothetical protein